MIRSRTKPLLTLSPCGTSLLTNGADSSLRTVLNHAANAARPEDVEAEPRAAIASQIERVRAKVLMVASRVKAGDNAAIRELRRMSAELNGLFALYDTGEGRAHAVQQGDIHHLLATDTWLGRATAEIVCDAIKQIGGSASVKIVGGLRTSNQAEYRAALADVIQFCESHFSHDFAESHDRVFNVSGGFKSVASVLTVLGMLYADRVVAAFIDEPLLTIPRVPVQLTDASLIREHIGVVRAMVNNGIAPLDPEAFDALGCLVDDVDGQMTLSLWGEVAWKREQRAIYEARLLPSPTLAIEYGDKFIRAMAGLSAEQTFKINERIDDLAKWLQTRANPSRLKVEQYKSHPEFWHCHAWDTGKAYRMILRLPGDNKIVIDDLIDHAEADRRFN